MSNHTEKLRSVACWTSVVISLGIAACAPSAPADNKAVADEVSATWTRAFDAGDATPMTRNGLSLSRMVFPTTAGSLPSSRRQ